MKKNKKKKKEKKFKKTEQEESDEFTRQLEKEMEELTKKDVEKPAGEESTQPVPKPDSTIKETPSSDVVEDISLEKERLEKERLEKERLEKERLEKERLEKERLEKERLEKERLEKERLEKERLEKERLEKERLEKERLEKERLEKERLEKERLEKERLEKERLEKERLEKERLEKERLEKERLEKERLEKERLELLQKQDRLVENNMLFIIPSWGDLLGYPTLGKYSNKDVAKLHSDIVIFFASLECAVKTETSTDYYIFGLGFFSTKFELIHEGELQHGKYITDNRVLTGMVLPDFVYDHLASSMNLTLENDPDVLIAEKVIKVPIDLSFKTDSQKTFIKGALMRNIFIPNKDIYLEMMDKIRLPENYNLNERGHLILSAHKDHFNKLLVSAKSRSHESSGYMKSTASIGEITYGADEHLEKTLSPIELQQIEQVLIKLKEVYSTLQYDHVYLYSLLKNAANALKTEENQIISKQLTSKDVLGSKEPILFSATNAMNSVVKWPEEFPRNKKEEMELIKPVQKPTLLPDVKLANISDFKIDDSQIKDYRAPPRQEDKFQLRTETNQTVGVKILPMAPLGDFEEVLLYVKWVIEEDFDQPSVGRALGMARDALKNRYPVEHQTVKWEFSKLQNIYGKKPISLGLSPKDKQEIIRKIDNWLVDIVKERKVEEERLERERLEKERIKGEKKEQLERERLEKERQEQERINREERTRLERERKERERVGKEKIEQEKIKLEEERKERERLEILRIEQEKIAEQRALEQLEFEKQEKLRLEQERIENERKELDALEREKRDLQRLTKERKGKEKIKKQQLKREKKLQKQKDKIAKKKALETAKLEKLKDS